MNAEKILTEVYWELSPLSADQIKYPDHDTLRKHLKKYLNSRYGTIIAKEGKMAGFLNEQVQEWYEKNKDLLSVIDKLTKRCEKLEEENDSLKDEFDILKDEFDIKVKVVKELNNKLESFDRNLRFSKSTITDLNNCLAEKRVKNRELKQKLDEITGLNNCNDLDKKAIFTSLGVNDTRSALDKIMEMKKLIKQNEEENIHLKDEVKAAVSREEIARRNLENRIHEVTELNLCLAEKNAKNKKLRCKVTDLECRIRQYEEDANNQLRKKVEDLQAAYDNCVNECADHVIEIDSLLQNLEVETVEQGIEKIKVLKDGCLITFNFSAEADLRVENEKLKKKIEDLRKDVKFEFDRRMTELAASTELKETVGKLRQKNEDLCRVLQEESIGRKRAESENTKLKSFIKGQTNLIHSMTDAIEQRLADLREGKNNE